MTGYRSRWPVFAIFIGDKEDAVHRAALESEAWQTIQFEQVFDREGVSRLMLVSENAGGGVDKGKEPILEIGAVEISRLR